MGAFCQQCVRVRLWPIFLVLPGNRLSDSSCPYLGTENGILSVEFIDTEIRFVFFYNTSAQVEGYLN